MSKNTLHLTAGTSYQDRGPSDDPSADEDFEALYRRLYRVVVGYFRRRVQSDLVEELTQETFLNAFRARQRFRGDVSDATWLLIIAKNVFSNHVRRLKTHKRDGVEVSIDAGVSADDDGVPQLPALAPDALAEALAEERRMIIRDAINALPRRTHQVMCLAFVQGLKYREIGKILEISENSVKSTIFHGKRKLREFISNEAPELEVDLGDGRDG